MKNLFLSVKEKLIKRSERPVEEEAFEEYIELGDSQGDSKAKVTVRPYSIDDFEDIKPVLNALREGYTIALVNIRPLRDKDIVELKRAINKLKKTCDAIDGDIAGFGDDYIVAVPNFAQIHRAGGDEELTE